MSAYAAPCFPCTRCTLSLSIPQKQNNELWYDFLHYGLVLLLLLLLLLLFIRLKTGSVLFPVG